MRGAYKVVRIAGVDVKVHWSFLILLAWMFLSYYYKTSSLTSALWGLGAVLAVFLCVVFHEFGHSLAAKRFGIKTEDIVLLPIGGVAQLERMPEKPREELIVALMGPAVNAVIAILLLIYLSATGQEVEYLGFLKNGISLEPRYFAENLFHINMVLLLFNLIPAFPMDGGRVLRAVLSMRWNASKATRFAAGVGRTLAVGLIFLGFFGNFWLVFIGLFVYLGATSESRQVFTRTALSGFKVSDVLMTKYTLLHEKDDLQKAIDILLDGQEKEFLVKDDDNMVVGVLTREAIVKGLNTGNRDQLISSVELAPPLELSLQMALQEAFELMMEKHASVAPVYDGQQLVGMLNQENIQEFLLIRRQEVNDDEEDIYEGEKPALREG